MIHRIRCETNETCEENIRNLDILVKDHLGRIDSFESLLLRLLKPFPKSGMRSQIGYIVKMDVESNMKDKKNKLSTIQRIMRWFR